MVGFIIINEVSLTISDDIEAENNELTTMTESLNFLFNNSLFILIPFALIIFFIMFNGIKRINLMAISFLIIGATIFISQNEKFFTNITENISTSNTTNIGQNFISTSIFSNIFGIMIIISILIGIVGAINIFRS